MADHRSFFLSWLPSTLLLVALLSSCSSKNDTPQTAADQFAVPQTEDTAELQRFIQDLMSFQPSSQEEAQTYRQKAAPAVQQAAQRIVELDPQGRSEASRFAKKVLLQMRIMAMEQQTAEQQEQTYQAVFEFIDQSPQLERSELAMAVNAARTLELYAHPAAGAAYQRLGDIFSKQQDEEVASFAEEMHAKARRYDLLGNEMTLSGTTLDGSTFNLDDWKGKVVLVDFWATWCDVCVGELPQIRELYEKYHSQGLEIVGVSLDANRPRLEAFVKRNEMPWTIVHHDDGTGEHPAAKYYGIDALPFVAMVDREGKVISIHARGEALEKLLREQFGE